MIMPLKPNVGLMSGVKFFLYSKLDKETPTINNNTDNLHPVKNVLVFRDPLLPLFCIQQQSNMHNGARIEKSNGPYS